MGKTENDRMYVARRQRERLFVGNKGTAKGSGDEHNIGLWKVAMNEV